MFDGETIQQRIDLSQGESVLIERVRDVDRLVDETVLDEDERLPYWASLWPSAAPLARHVYGAEELRGPALELGCGLGLCSVAAARRGIEVWATDYEEDALEMAARNAAHNAVELRLELMDWRSPRLDRQFASVFGADLLYEARKVEPLIEVIDRLMAPDGHCWISDPKRPHLATFEHKLTQRGFSSQRCLAPGDDLVSVASDIVILAVTRTRAHSGPIGSSA